jgi:hypothetical protein
MAVSQGSQGQPGTSHRTFKHIGFGAGINDQTIGVEVDGEELFWEISDNFVGFLVMASFSF